MDQIGLFDDELLPGTWVKTHGRELAFDEVAKRVGQMIIMDMSTESHEWFKVVMVEKIVTNFETGQRRLIYYDGGRQRGLVDERYFPENYTGRFPARAYEVT